MFALLCFVLTVMASPFESKSRLEAENMVLWHQLNVLRRKTQGRIWLMNSDRWFFVHSKSLQATAARQVSIAMARKPRCVDAEVR
jgi:hypothetical protein